MKQILWEREAPRVARRALGLLWVLAVSGGCSSAERAIEVPRGQEFQNPDEFTKDAHGIYPLNIQLGRFTFDDGSTRKTLCLRTYNGKLTGPTLRVKAEPGQQRSFQLDLTNRLGTHASGGGHEHAAMSLDDTNLHTHGLHVSPGPQKGSSGRQSDNVFLTVKPGETQNYEFFIDLDAQRQHEPGTFWYHPHLHGATTVQVGNGMAGALIVEGAADAFVNVAQDRIFVFQHIAYDSEDVHEADADTSCSEQDPSINDEKTAVATNTTLINGQLWPQLTVRPGQVERWRFIHAGAANLMQISLRKSPDGNCTVPITGTETIQVQQIASDGILHDRWGAPQTDTLLAPGNRADLIMTAPASEGTYCLVNNDAIDLNQTAAQKLLAKLVVKSSAEPPVCTTASCCTTGACTGPNKDQLTAAGKKTDEAERYCASGAPADQRLVLAQQDCPNGTPATNINCKTFDTEVVNRVLPLGQTQLWSIKAEGVLGFHPFHIHVNPFYVCPVTRSDGTKTTGRWMDTAVVDSKSSEPTMSELKLVMKYEDFTGDFVLHCHKLAHEDQGMMEFIRIQ